MAATANFLSAARFIVLLLLLTATESVLCADDRIPALPGAEGFGARSTGGHGGQVIKVTNLGLRGPGSLQAAHSAEGPRILRLGERRDDRYLQRPGCDDPVVQH